MQHAALNMTPGSAGQESTLREITTARIGDTPSLPISADPANGLNDDEPLRKRPRLQDECTPKRPPETFQQPPRCHMEVFFELLEENRRLQKHNVRLNEHNDELRELNEELRRTSTQIHQKGLTVIGNVVRSNAVIEAAVDTREAEMRTALSNLWGTPVQMKEQAIQLLKFSSKTSWLVTGLVEEAMQDHQDFLGDNEHRKMQLHYENAEPSPEAAAIINEKLLFIMEGPNISNSITLDL